MKPAAAKAIIAPESACQYAMLPAMGRELNAAERALRFAQLKARGARRRLRRYAARLGLVRTPPAEAAGSLPGKPLGLKAGERVRVRSLAEIQATLDEKNRLGGLDFMPAMAAFCGRSVHVLKPVRLVYDECGKVMRKVRNCVILEGVICDGSDQWHKEGCDRSCFYFWKEQWLEREPDGPDRTEA
ncbi:MAG: hypothetical protein JW819_10125 [Candidatus Krumholzibacteriota bacterium]|nr:hypothetical protein [Candidatus Krumholzibacteriota bacterium]